jgi:alkanesulfonate monooxygenase SsuD/methylene tetrahydromethanopterin reductase-like flavin-dependent oxidoreductase (luciferase family)
VQVARGLWDSFEDDAFPADVERGIFLDPAKPHAVDHRGEHFRVDGPLDIARSPQGQPVISRRASPRRAGTSRRTTSTSRPARPPTAATPTTSRSSSTAARSSARSPFVGAPETVADTIEQWFEAGTFDGINPAFRNDEDLTRRQLAGPAATRFDALDLTCSDDGAVTIADGIAWFDTTIHHAVGAGDHTIVLLRRHSARHVDHAPPLVFHRSGFGLAPTPPHPREG